MSVASDEVGGEAGRQINHGETVPELANSPGEAEPPTKSVAERGDRSATGKQ